MNEHILKLEAYVNEKTYSLREIAQMCAVHPTTPKRWLKKGVRGQILPSLLVGGKRRVRAQDLAKFIRYDQ